MNIEGTDGLEFSGELKARPMLLKDLVEMDAYIHKAYLLSRKLSPEDAQCIEYIARLACEYLSDLCDEMGICSAEADFDHYISCLYKA